MLLNKEQEYYLFEKLDKYLNNINYKFDEKIIGRYYFSIYYDSDLNKFTYKKIYYLGDDQYTHHKNVFRSKSCLDNSWTLMSSHYFYYRSLSQVKKHCWMLNHWKKKLIQN